LRRVLNADQWESYVDTESFHVRGSDGHTYRIENGTNGNVVKIDSKCTDRIRYCAHPNMYMDETRTGDPLPVPDVLLGQALALITDAPAFLDVANIHEQWDEDGHELQRGYDLPAQYFPAAETYRPQRLN
jgi:hypothetical protein